MRLAEAGRQRLRAAEAGRRRLRAAEAGRVEPFAPQAPRDGQERQRGGLDAHGIDNRAVGGRDHALRREIAPDPTGRVTHEPGS